ncbi:MAG: hypothetical protein A3C35_04265 [Omnitrophica bacterium RIFCSPHIGHO2_02_FULL_46_11]|nr:MAG: hypothetical protein A3C35_04265 [Omnitrophica bacterium RIFCSPHIGHO2_02_FULL_46_11]
MDKLAKSLAKLSPKEQKQLDRILARLINLDWLGLDIVKLRGNDEVYRVRGGRLRVIFSYHGKQVKILQIERRPEKTYRNY